MSEPTMELEHSDAIELAKALIALEVADPYSMYGGEGKVWILRIIDRLYKEGFSVVKK